MDRDALIAALARVLVARTDVVAAYLFGSVARGEARADSDADVGVVLAAGPPRDLPALSALGNLQADLEEASDREVDLVVLDGAPVDLVHRVLRDGVLLCEAAIDVAAIIVSARRHGEPRTNRELFQKLAQDGWLREADLPTWNGIVAFRDIVVHRYLQVAPAVVRTIVEERLEDLLRFGRQVRDRMQSGV